MFGLLISAIGQQHHDGLWCLFGTAQSRTQAGVILLRVRHGTQ